MLWVIGCRGLWAVRCRGGLDGFRRRFVRGGVVFAGFWGEGDCSRSAFREGWLATGVAVEVVAEGVFRVVGRLRAQSALMEVPGRFVALEHPGADEEVVGEGDAVFAEEAAGVVAPTAALPLGEQSVESVERVEPAVEGPSDAELVAEFEARLRAHPLISQVLVIVEGRPFASALVTLVRDQLEYWRLVNGRPLSMAPEEIAGDRDLLREVQGLVYE